MKKTLLLLLVFFLTVCLWVLLYFFLFPVLDTSDSSLEGSSSVKEAEVVSPSLKTSGTTTSFEESFYQDLSDFFNSNNYYQDIEGEYWFIYP